VARAGKADPLVKARLHWPDSLTFPLLLLLILCAFYWKLILTYQFDWVWGPDLAQQVLPWFDEEARQVQHHHFPLWDPHGWLGQPLVGQAQPGAVYPLNWLLWLMPRRSGHIQILFLQWYFIAIHYMAALFTYLLCRDLGRSRPASMIAGLVFSLAAYVGTTDWPQMLNGAVWAPLVFLFLLRAFRGERVWASAAASGACLGMSWLSGHHQIPIFITLAAGGAWLIHIFRNGRLDWRAAQLAAASFLFTAAVGALQILPAREYGKLALRWVGAQEGPVTWNTPVPYYVHRGFALNPINLLAILFPGRGGNSDPFIGVTAFVLALAAIALAWNRSAVRFLGGVALFGIVYALGQNSVFNGFIYAAVPLVEKARVPAMAVVLFGAGASALVAFGVDYFGAEPGNVWTRRLALGSLVFGLLVFALILSTMFNNKLSWDSDDRVGTAALAGVLLAALLWGWRSGSLKPAAALTLLTMLVLFEQGNDAGMRPSYRADAGSRSYIEKTFGNADIASFLNGKPRPFRVEANSDTLSDNWGDYYNLDFMKNYTGVTINSFQFEVAGWETRMLVGTRYTISPTPVHDGETEVFSGASGLKVFENPGAFPRAWSVHAIMPIRNADEGRKFIYEHLDELHSKALMEGGALTLPLCQATDSVTVTDYGASDLGIRADMGCDGMVVTSDTYFPGWKATVDGASSPIHEVNLAMRGVLVPKGSHHIRMRYQPGSVYLGGALTACGLLAAAVLSFRARKQAVSH
jgi:hypothetical protein